MLHSLSAKNFKAVAHLETSQLMLAHPNGVKFSTDKPNVIVGPNGAGKSALMSALALQTLSFFVGASSLDDNYVRGHNCDELWGEGGSRWEPEPVYLPGLSCTGEAGPALYYRPGHIPGNDNSVTASMMCGYFNEARHYGRLVDSKSSGQQSRALLAKLQAVLCGEDSDLQYGQVNWRFGAELRDLSKDRYAAVYEYRAETLKKRSASSTGKPVLLMDEPEQSLDALAEAQLWTQISKVDTSRMQVIVATHSLYPLLHPEQFHLIEAVPGYAEQVKALL